MRAAQHGRGTWRAVAPALVVAILPALSARGQDLTPIPRDLFEQQCDQLKLEGSARDAAAGAYAAYRDALQLLREHHDLTGAWLASIPRQQVSGRVPKNLDERDKPLVILQGDVWEALQASEVELIGETEAMYFDTLQQISGADDDLIADLKRDWKRTRRLPGVGPNFGGNVDLARLIHRSLPHAVRDEAVAELLRDWAIRVDQFLADLTVAQERRSERFRDILEDAKVGKATFEDAARAMLEVSFLRHELISINERTIGRIRAVLPDEDAELLRQAWIEAKWPFVWYRGREDRRITAARARDDISEDQRTALVQLQSEIDALRSRATRNLERLRTAAVDRDYMIGFWTQWFEWNTIGNREGARATDERSEAFDNACRKFVEDIETLGTRIDQILSPSGGSS